MDASPRRNAFAEVYEAGRPQVVWTTLVADLETPVAAMMKLAEGERHGFLLESVEGGTARGRYSYIGLRPDLVWRCRGERAEINRAVRLGQVSYDASPLPALASLRALVEECRIELPPELPPGSASLIGFFAYDFVRLIERLPSANPDELGLPDAMLMRPTVVLVFDNVLDRVAVVTPVYPERALSARAAYDRALERLANTVADLGRGLPHQSLAGRAGPAPVASRTSPASSTTRWWGGPRSTSAPATPSRWCRRSASPCPSGCRRWRCTGRCAGSTRRPFPSA
jgi:anthranilate synthase component 1